MIAVPLSPGIPGGRQAYLRPLCGHDEALLDGSGSADVIAFLDRLLAAAPDTTVASGKARDLAVCDCDRLCAALYLRYFGDRIDGRLSCGSCGKPFELNFSLGRLMENLAVSAARSLSSGPDDDGVYTLPEGQRFRLPTAGEKQEVCGLDPEQAVAILLRRCVLEEAAELDLQRLERAMDEAGALLDFDLDATCPECETEQTVRFDIQAYLLRALQSEKPFLLYEIHTIASVYGWGYQEILSLRREDRRTFARLILAGRSAPRGMEF
jgi:hypothetical protein